MRVSGSGYIGKPFDKGDYVKVRLYETLDPPDLNWPSHGPSVVIIKAYGQCAIDLLELPADTKIDYEGEIFLRDAMEYGEYGVTGRRTSIVIELRD